MASYKISELNSVTDTTSESLLMLSYTDDGGTTFATKQIAISDMFDDIGIETAAQVAAEAAARDTAISTAVNNLVDGAPALLDTLSEISAAINDDENFFTTISSLISELDGNCNSVIALSGVAENAENLGTFSGSTIADSSTIKTALQALETYAETKASSASVAEIDQNVDDLITLSGVAENDSDLGAFTGSTIGANKTVKAAAQALETQMDDLVSLAGAGASTGHLGTFTGTTIADSQTIKTALQSLETLLETTAAEQTEDEQNTDDLITLSGVNENAVDLGTFSGGTIADNVTVKAALQSLETKAEANKVLADTMTPLGTNVNQLIGNTSAQAEPDNYLFLVIDQVDGSIKVMSKTFIEVE